MSLCFLENLKAQVAQSLTLCIHSHLLTFLVPHRYHRRTAADLCRRKTLEKKQKQRHLISTHVEKWSIKATIYHEQARFQLTLTSILVEASCRPKRMTVRHL